MQSTTQSSSNKKSLKKVKFDKHILLLGFGSIARALLPLLLDRLDIQKNQISIIANDDTSEAVAKENGIAYQNHTITAKNYLKIIGENCMTETSW